MPQPAAIDALTDAQREAVEALLVQFRFKDYAGAVEQVNGYLEQHGAPVRFSRSALWRVGSKLERRLERIRASTEAARAIVAAAPDEAGDQSQAVIALVQSDLFDSLNMLEEAYDAETAEARIGLLKDAAKAASEAGRASILIKTHAAKVRKAEREQAAKDAEAAALAAGCDTETAAKIGAGVRIYLPDNGRG